ncbi:hypothetical protein J22TS1_01900 [Siminovitchia terrae]|nr:hypothetical protein J22TS1_01900 [Siminovitchia terrae]
MATFRKRGNSWEYRVYYTCKQTGEEKNSPFQASEQKQKLRSLQIKWKLK